jgi:hypothetical protein
MEYKITKKDYRGLLLGNFAPILIVCVSVAFLNVANGLTIDGDLTVIILEYIAATMLIFLWIAQVVLILHLVNKEFVKGSQESLFIIQRENGKFRYENLSTGKKIEFSINDILDIRLFKKLGLIEIKQGKIGSRIAVEVNDFSKQLKDEVQELKKLKKENRKKEKQNKKNKGE